jgi:SH3 domain-containing YSC84-like protein 1
MLHFPPALFAGSFPVRGGENFAGYRKSSAAFASKQEVVEKSGPGGPKWQRSLILKRNLYSMLSGYGAVSSGFVQGSVVCHGGLLLQTVEISLKERGMKRTVVALTLMGLMVLPVFGQDKQEVKEADRVKAAGDVISQIMNIPDDIPQDVIDKADCVVVLPSVLKAAFIFGGSYGRGVMTCRSGRTFHGPWSAPTMMALEGASFGLQLGGQATDFVLLLMSPKSAANILSSKVKIGGDASAAAGPVGRNASAETDITMRAEILSYSRARGLFAGISLAGSTLRPDNDGNKNLYGQAVTAQAIVFDKAVPPPPSAALLLRTLNKRSPKNLSK